MIGCRVFAKLELILPFNVIWTVFRAPLNQLGHFGPSGHRPLNSSISRGKNAINPDKLVRIIQANATCAIIWATTIKRTRTRSKRTRKRSKGPGKQGKRPGNHSKHPEIDRKYARLPFLTSFVLDEDGFDCGFGGWMRIEVVVLLSTPKILTTLGEYIHLTFSLVVCKKAEDFGG